MHCLRCRPWVECKLSGFLDIRDTVVAAAQLARFATSDGCFCAAAGQCVNAARTRLLGSLDYQYIM